MVMREADMALGSKARAPGPALGRWSLWRSLVAGAVIGFVEAAGPEEHRRRLLSQSEAVVRFHERQPDAACPRGLWFLAPLRNLTRQLSRN